MKKTSENVRLTKLVQGKHDPTRVNLFLNGKFAFSLTADEVIKRGLHAGIELETEIVSELATLSEQEKLFAKVINFLSYRPRSVQEVKEKLYTYLGPNRDTEKEALIEKVKKLGYLNDLEFARWFAKSRRVHRPRSVRHLSSELYAKGIEKSVIAQVIREEGDDHEAIRKIIKKRRGTDTNKLIPYLARKGFSWELIREALEEVEAK